MQQTAQAMTKDCFTRVLWTSPPGFTETFFWDTEHPYILNDPEDTEARKRSSSAMGMKKPASSSSSAKGMKKPAASTAWKLEHSRIYHQTRATAEAQGKSEEAAKALAAKACAKRKETWVSEF